MKLFVNAREMLRVSNRSTKLKCVYCGIIDYMYMFDGQPKCQHCGHWLYIDMEAKRNCPIQHIINNKRLIRGKMENNIIFDDYAGWGAKYE